MSVVASAQRQPRAGDTRRTLSLELTDQLEQVRDARHTTAAGWQRLMYIVGVMLTVTQSVLRGRQRPRADGTCRTLLEST